MCGFIGIGISSSIVLVAPYNGRQRAYTRWRYGAVDFTRINKVNNQFNI